MVRRHSADLLLDTISPTIDVLGLKPSPDAAKALRVLGNAGASQEEVLRLLQDVVSTHPLMLPHRKQSRSATRRQEFREALRAMAKRIAENNKDGGAELRAFVWPGKVDGKVSQKEQLYNLLPELLESYASDLEDKIRSLGRAKLHAPETDTSAKVKLVDFIRRSTGRPHLTEISTLVLASYEANGIADQECDPKALRLLWKRNPHFRYELPAVDVGPILSSE